MRQVFLFAILFLNDAAILDNVDLINKHQDLLEEMEVPKEISKRWSKVHKVW